MGIDGVGDNLIIDSRVHMLKRGWFPCIPGWHLDDFHRGADGQPALASLPPKLSHLMCIVGGVSRTQFLDGPVELERPLPGEVTYDTFNRQIRRLVNAQEVGVVDVEPSQIVRFGGSDFHRGTAATGDGWRWFIRATRFSERFALNEVRSQVQVYLPWPEAGW